MPRAEEPRRLTSGAIAHNFTDEERRRGAETTNAKRRQQREDAERIALEHLAMLRVKAWLKLGDLVDAESESVQAQAVREILDRDLGKPGQPLELSGPDGGPIEVTDARERLASGIAGIAARTGQTEAPS